MSVLLAPSSKPRQFRAQTGQMNERGAEAGYGRDDWRSLLLIFVGFLAFTSLVYRNYLYDLPKRDHPSVIAERGLVGSDWDWFLHVKSLSRARFIAQGDHYIFRPLTLGVLALEDIVLRENRAAVGFLSFVFQAFAGFCCYRLLSVVLPRGWAILAASVYLIQFTGVELIAWRHISGYLFAPAFLAIGLRRLLVSRSQRSSMLVTAASLLAAALFHEIALVVECALLPALAVTHFWRPLAAESAPLAIDSRRWVRPLLAAISLYFLLDAADYAWYQPGPLFHAQDRQLHWSNIHEVLQYAAALVTATLAGPWSGAIQTPSGMLGIPIHGVANEWLGGGLILALFCAAAWCLRNLRRNRDQAMYGIGLTAILGLFGLIFGVGLLRGAMRGMNYLEEATYYYGIANFFVALLLGWGLYALRSSRSMVGRIAAMALAGYLVVLGAGNTLRVEAFASAHVPASARLAHDVIHKAHKFLSSHPEYAYGGTLPPLKPGEPDSLEWTKAAGVDLALSRHYLLAPAEATRLYLHAIDDVAYLGTIAQSPGTSGRCEPVEFQLHNTRFRKTSEGLYSEPPTGDLKEGTGFVVSKPADTMVQLDLKLANSGTGGMLFDYQGERDYGMLTFREGRWYWHVMRDGKLSPMLFHNVVLQDRPAVQVRLLRTDRWILGFVDGFIMSYLPTDQLPQSNGRVGLFYQSSRPTGRMAFSDVYRTTSSGRSAVQVGFTPIHRLGRMAGDRLLTD
ncbi:MAG TPA: hypothetical protein VHV55_09320 [Pirellulales bacterium]|nr:hypothetical protein [Pirellulales bacterium]